MLAPVLLLVHLKKHKKSNGFIFYFIIGLVLLTLLITAFAWWSYKSDLILLKHYGYDINSVNHVELYQNVSPKNMERVKSLERSLTGIGWPLKVFFSFIYIVPYLFLVYYVNIALHKLKRNKNKA